MGFLKIIVLLTGKFDQALGELRAEQANELDKLWHESDKIISEFLNFDEQKLTALFSNALMEANTEIKRRHNSLLDPISLKEAGLLKLVYLFKSAEQMNLNGEMEQIFVAIHSFLEKHSGLEIDPRASYKALESLRNFEQYMLSK